MQEPEYTPVTLNKAIKKLFYRLSAADSEKAATDEIAEIYRCLDQNKNLVNAATIAMLFHRLGSCSIAKQALCQKLILLTIHLASIYLKKRPREFGVGEISQIICALPTLPIAWNNYPKFVLRLIKKLDSILDSNEKFEDTMLITLLCVLARLGFLVNNPLPVILKMCEQLKLLEEEVSDLNQSLTSQLWQFCVYAKSRFEGEKTIDQLFAWIDPHMRANPPTPGDSSEFHLDLVDFLRQHLKKEFADEIQSEYIVGTYALDIAIASLKLNIEVDGNQHYRDEALIRKDRFRDFILQYYGQWATVRIPLREFHHLSAPAKLGYLYEKLGQFNHILKPFAPNVTKGLVKHHLLKNKASQPNKVRPPKPSKKPVEKSKKNP